MRVIVQTDICMLSNVLELYQNPERLHTRDLHMTGMDPTYVQYIIGGLCGPPITYPERFLIYGLARSSSNT